MKRGLKFSQVIQGSKVSPFSLSILHMIVSETILMLRWMSDTFEFNQSQKQTESKMEVTRKISSNK